MDQVYSHEAQNLQRQRNLKNILFNLTLYFLSIKKCLSYHNNFQDNHNNLIYITVYHVIFYQRLLKSS